MNTNFFNRFKYHNKIKIKKNFLLINALTIVNSIVTKL